MFDDTVWYVPSSPESRCRPGSGGGGSAGHGLVRAAEGLRAGDRSEGVTDERVDLVVEVLGALPGRRAHPGAVQRRRGPELAGRGLQPVRGLGHLAVD